MRSSNSHDRLLRPDESFDEFMGGRLRLIQSKRGYRFSIDAVLLSQFVTVKPGDMVADLGTGCGIIGLILLLTRPVRSVFGLEIQPYLADLAVRNAALNGFRDRMRVIVGDIRHPPFAARRMDLVVCNPPYRKGLSGRINPDSEKAIARHEIMASLGDVLRTASEILRPKGRLAMIYPAVRLVDALSEMRSVGLEPKRIRIVYPRMDSEAKLVLIEASLRGRGGLKLLPPLMDQGDFSIARVA
jgi:tRNA1Val (adenine37-N6)-methyltransferase